MKELTLKVEGMVCNGCENRVQNAVKQIDGVENVVADYKNGTVLVTLNKEIDKKIIEERIEDIGFKVKE